MEEKVKKMLLPAVRQYQHNDCSGFVFGYELEATEKIIKILLTTMTRRTELSQEVLDEISNHYAYLKSY